MDRIRAARHGAGAGTGAGDRTEDRRLPGAPRAPAGGTPWRPCGHGYPRRQSFPTTRGLAWRRTSTLAPKGTAWTRRYREGWASARRTARPG